MKSSSSNTHEKEVPRQSSSSNLFGFTSPIPLQGNDIGSSNRVNDRLLRNLRPSMIQLEADLIRSKRSLSYNQLEHETQSINESPQKRKWKKLLSKISFKPEVDNYYDDLPFKPGLDMYRALFDEEEFSHKLPLKALKIRVPETAAVFSNLYWISYNYQKDELKTDVNFRVPGFYKKIKKINKTMYDKKNNPTEPAVIVRTQASNNLSGQKNVMTWSDVDERMNAGIDTNTLVQQFVFVHGTKPSFFRLHYFNPFASSLKRNYGYFISNIESMYEQHSKERTLTERVTVCTEREYSFEVYTLRGNVINMYETQAQSLVDYLSQSFRFRIQEIVVDFLKDEKGVAFFLNVKAFKVDRTSKIFRDLQLQPFQGGVIKSSRNIQSRDQPHNLVKCSLCKHLFSKQEAKRILTVSMIQNLFAHLDKRGEFTLQELQPKIPSSFSNQRNNSCRVCDLCYMLIVAEHELIEIEQEFAKSLNVPVTPEPIPPNAVARIQSHFKKCAAETIGNRLMQWRLMFYIENIYVSSEQFQQDLSLDELPKEQDIYLQLKYLNYTTKFKLHPTPQQAFNVCVEPVTTEDGFQKVASALIGKKATEINTIQSETEEYTNPLKPDKTDSEWNEYTDGSKFQTTSEQTDNRQPLSSRTHMKYKYDFNAVKVNKVRLHFFFGQDCLEVMNFLSNVELELRLTAGPDWNEILAMGSCMPFVHFQIGQNFQVGRERLQVHLFSKEVDHFFLNMYSGVVRDKFIKVNPHMKLDIVSRNVFFPPQDYFNCDLLPIEWLELLDDRLLQTNELYKILEESKERALFTPFCTVKELNFPLTERSQQKPRIFSDLMRPTFSSALKRRPCIHQNGVQSDRERARSSRYRSEALGKLPRISKEDFLKTATQWVSENERESNDEVMEPPKLEQEEKESDDKEEPKDLLTHRVGGVKSSLHQIMRRSWSEMPIKPLGSTAIKFNSQISPIKKIQRSGSHHSFTSRFFSPIQRSIRSLLPEKSSKQQILKQAIEGMFPRKKRKKIKRFKVELDQPDIPTYYQFPPDSLSPSNSSAITSPTTRMHPSMSLPGLQPVNDQLNIHSFPLSPMGQSGGLQAIPQELRSQEEGMFSDHEIRRGSLLPPIKKRKIKRRKIVKQVRLHPVVIDTYLGQPSSMPKTTRHSKTSSREHFLERQKERRILSKLPAFMKQRNKKRQSLHNEVLEWWMEENQKL